MVVLVKTHKPNIQPFVLLMSEYEYLQSAKQKTILWKMENVLFFMVTDHGIHSAVKENPQFKKEIWNQFKHYKDFDLQ